MSHFTAKAVELQATDSAGPKAARGPLLQRSAGPSGANAAVPRLVQEVIGSQGQPLDAQTRAFMETRFEHDFSRVRVHTDAAAAQSAQAVNALAYTVGGDVAFSESAYQPGTSAGRRLLAHELTHVVQQQKSQAAVQKAPLTLGRPDDRAEREAEQAAEVIQQGGLLRHLSYQSEPAAILRRQPAPGPVACKPDEMSILANYLKPPVTKCVGVGKSGAVVAEYQANTRQKPAAAHMDDKDLGDKDAVALKFNLPILIFPPAVLKSPSPDLFVFFHGHRADLGERTASGGGKTAQGSEEIAKDAHLQEALIGTGRIGIAPQAPRTWRWRGKFEGGKKVIKDGKEVGEWVPSWNWDQALKDVHFEGLVDLSLQKLNDALQPEITLKAGPIHVAGHSGGGGGIEESADRAKGVVNKYGDQIQDVTLEDAGYGNNTNWSHLQDWFLYGTSPKIVRVLVSQSAGGTQKSPGDTRSILGDPFTKAKIEAVLAKDNKSDILEVVQAVIEKPPAPGSSTPTPLPTPAPPGGTTPAPKQTPAAPGGTTPTPQPTPAPPGGTTPAPKQTPAAPGGSAPAPKQTPAAPGGSAPTPQPTPAAPGGIVVPLSDQYSRVGGFIIESMLVVRYKKDFKDAQNVEHKAGEPQGTMIVFFAPGGSHYANLYSSIRDAATNQGETTGFLKEVKTGGQYRVIQSNREDQIGAFKDLNRTKTDKPLKMLLPDTVVSVLDVKPGNIPFGDDMVTAPNAQIKVDEDLVWIPLSNLAETLPSPPAPPAPPPVPAAPTAPAPAKKTQPKLNPSSTLSDEQRSARAQQAASRGLLGLAARLPFLEQIQHAFGPRHDLTGVQAHLDEQAAAANRSMGAVAYTAGNRIAFDGWPDLHTAAHEAAHVVQQRSGVSLPGGVGRAGDPYEQHADAVAERVASGQSAAALLDELSLHSGASSGGLQRRPLPRGAIPSSDLDPLDNRNENAFRARIYDAQQQWAIENRTFTAGIPDTELDDIEDGKKMLKTAVPDAKISWQKHDPDLADQQAANNAHAKKVRKIGIDNAYRGMAAEKLAWQGAYLTHYNRSQEERAGLEGGEFGEKAFQLLLNRMINYKAIPGFSNHSRGLAIDFMTDERGLGELGPYSSQKADWQNSWFWKWLGDNAATYHFSPLSTEEWHWDHS